MIGSDIQLETKKFIVVDTNFLIARKKDLSNIFASKSENYDVYVTRVSINERIGQEYRNTKKDYVKLKKLESSYRNYTNIDISNSLDEIFEKKATSIKNNYEKYCAGKIIENIVADDGLNAVLDRAYKKIPPFIDADNSSDKGFKDTIMWLSIVEFFKNKDVEGDIYFLTSDGGFKEQVAKDFLYNEFKISTGKQINILENKKFDELIKNTSDTEIENNTESTKREPVLSVKLYEVEEIPKETRRKIRIEVDKALDNIFLMEDLNPYSPFSVENRYMLKNAVDISMIEDILDGLAEYVKMNMLSFTVNFSDYLVEYGVDVIEYRSIEIENIEDLAELYATILKEYESLLPMFYNAVMQKFNYYYKEETDNHIYNDDSLPF